MFKKWGLGLFFAGVASFGGAPMVAMATPGGTGAFMPKDIEIAPDYVYIRVAPDTAAGLQNIDDCDKKDVLIIPSDDSTLRAEMISVVLSSLSFGKPLSVWVPRCEPLHWAGSPTAPYVGSVFMHRQ
ncbi:hypothetical protein ACEK07_19350 [Alcanivoracaceae bacterium MT1]